MAQTQVLQGAHPTAQAFLDGRSGSASSQNVNQALLSRFEAAPDELFQVFVQGHYGVKDASGKAYVRSLNSFEQQTCLDVFGKISLPKLRKWIAKQGAKNLTDAKRLAVLKILGAHGMRPDLVSLLHWTVDADSKSRVPRALRTEFLNSLTAILKRDPRAMLGIHELYRLSHPALLPSIAHAVGASGHPDSIDALTDLIHVVPRANSLLLAEISQAANTTRRPLSEKALKRVQSVLESSEGTTRTAAIQTAGDTGLRAAVPSLIDWLKSEDSNLRKQAHVALKKITKQQFRVDPERWKAWYDREVTWYQEEYPDLKHTALHGVGGLASNALKEISKRRFYRERTSPDLLPCLERPEPELVVLTCAVLGHLGSYSSVGPLLEQLEEDKSTAVRKSAFDALRRITGENHGDTPQAWRSAGW